MGFRSRGRCPRNGPPRWNPLTTHPIALATPGPVDVRFSYANEHTFLAWNRTALALVTAGLAPAGLVLAYLRPL
jgi:uncharacterized membrane protein YidH (DUF202 family)